MKKNIKGMIMSIEEGCAIVLTSGGEFLKTEVTTGQYFIGDEISFDAKEDFDIWKVFSKVSFKVPKPALQLVLSLCLIFAGGIGTWAYPVGHVYMDVNPSMGMSYNLYHRVIGMESFNEDGAKVMGKVSYYGKTIDEGLENTLKVMNEEGYIKTEEQGIGGILIGYTDSRLEKAFVKSAMVASGKMNKILQIASVAVDPEAEQIAKEEKGKKDSISPIQATLAAREMKSNHIGDSKDKDSKAQFKAEVKAKAKELKGKATLQVIEENQSSVQVVANPKVEEIKKKNEAIRKLIKERKAREEKNKENKEDKNKEDKDHEEKRGEEHIQKDKDNKEEDKDQKNEDKDHKDLKQQPQNDKPTENPNLKVDRDRRLQKIVDEIAKLNALIEEIQSDGGKDNKKSAKIKKILRQIERLEEEREKLQDD